MCEFCENINNDEEYEKPHLMYGNYCSKEKPMFYIDVPTEEGLSYSVDNINYCPMCGRDLRGKSDGKDI